MTADTHVEIARRLLANVEAGTSDQADGQMKVPITVYRDAASLGDRDGAGVPAVTADGGPVGRRA